MNPTPQVPPAQFIDEKVQRGFTREEAQTIWDLSHIGLRPIEEYYAESDAVVLANPVEAYKDDARAAILADRQDGRKASLSEVHARAIALRQEAMERARAEILRDRRLEVAQREQEAEAAIRRQGVIA